MKNHKKMKTLKSALILLCCVGSQAWGQSVSGKSNPVTVDYSPKATNPVIVWLTPDQNVTNLEAKKVTLKVGVNSVPPLTSVTVYVNGVEPVTRGFGVSSSSEAAKFTKFIEKELDLTGGPNEIKVVAVNNKSETTTESRMVNVTAPVVVANQRNDYALIVGTNDYNEWSNLVNPIFDARSIASELEKFYGFQVELLLNPTKNEFLGKVREYAKKNYLPNDQLFIFVAGHGQFDEIFKAGYLVFKDSRLNDETKDSYLNHTIMRDYLESIPCKHILLMMDACFGGTFDTVLAKRGEEDGMYQDVARDEFINRKLQFKTRKYITSGGKEYVPDGKPNQHSPFAKRVMAAFRDYGGRDKVLTSQEMWVNYIETAKPTPTIGEFGSNEPGSEFVFVAK
jgi:hypothetical protein